MYAIEVRPSAKGVATIYDKEIVLYNRQPDGGEIERGEEGGRTFIFTAHDLFSVTGANHSARSYQRLSRHWSGCRYARSRPISRRAAKGEEGFFSWLSEARLHYSKTRTASVG